MPRCVNRAGNPSSSLDHAARKWHPLGIAWSSFGLTQGRRRLCACRLGVLAGEDFGIQSREVLHRKLTDHISVLAFFILQESDACHDGQLIWQHGCLALTSAKYRTRLQVKATNVPMSFKLSGKEKFRLAVQYPVRASTSG